MKSELPARIVNTVLTHLSQQADFFEWWQLLDDDDRQALEDELADVVQHEIARDANDAIAGFVATKGRRP